MGFKRISLRKEGDILEVRLRDSGFKKFFEGKAQVENKREMEELRAKLRNKGVPL